MGEASSSDLMEPLFDRATPENMETKFTKGPWLVYDADGSIGSVESASGIPVAQAQMQGSLRFPDNDTRRANARLIAASPTLFEALAALVRINEEHNEAVKKVVQVHPGWNDSYLDAARAALRLATEGWSQ